MRQTNKPKGKTLADIDNALSNIEIPKQEVKEEESKTLLAYGLLQNPNKKFEIVTIEYGLDNDDAKVLKREIFPKDNFIKALDKIREHYVKDIKFPQLKK